MRLPLLGATLVRVVVGTVLFATPVGTCGVAYSDVGLVAVVLPSQTETATRRALERAVQRRKLELSAEAQPPPWLAAAEGAIVRALTDGAGADADLAEIPLDARGLSDFQGRVFAAARRIPRGQVASYGELARASGSPGAARAIGRAMATNPFPVVVPCHRVVGSQGDLHGFSSPGGVKTKAALLAIEGCSEPTRAQPTRPRAESAQPELPFAEAGAARAPRS